MLKFPASKFNCITIIGFFTKISLVLIREATFTEEQKANFYKTVPPLMHHFPYMHILQQRMMQQQQFAQTNQMDSRSQQIDALKQTGILSLLSSQEGRQKLQNLATRVQESKTRLSDEISTWGDEQKDSFFDSFHEHPALQSLKNSGEEPIGRITKFLDLSDSELDDMMKLMLVISTSGEKYSKNLSQTGDGADTVDEKQLMQGIVATLGSLSTMNTQGRQHVHDANCGHGQGQGSSNSFTGKADRMDR